MKIFDPDGLLMGVLGKLADIVFINMMFVITSIPVFTIGASLSALYDCCFSLIEDTEDVFLPRQYLKSFAKHFKRGTGAWIIALLVITFLGSYSWVIGFFGGSLGRIYKITFWVLLFLFLFGFQYIFPLISQREDKVFQIWTYAWKLAISVLPWSLLHLVLVAGISILASTVIPASISLYLWMILLFGLIGFFSSLVIHKVLSSFGGNS